MVGNESVRYCPECKLDVYNFSTMSDEEIEQIVSGSQQRLCARVRQRPDGTVMTRNSSVRFSIVMRRISRVAHIALTAAISVSPAMARPPHATPEQNLFQIQPRPTGIALIVVDSSGAAIPKARITILNEKTKTEIKGETDANGQFRVSELPDGTYEIRVDVFGFETFKQSHVDVPGRVPLRLQLHRQVDFVGKVAAVKHPNGFQKFISKLRHIF
jgi:Carboxypeptidase regulatory-like domain